METRERPPLVEPPPPPGDRVERCLNCDTDLLGAYCHVCGQDGTDRNLSVRRLLHDFLGDMFSFDGRFFRTLRPLFIRPGALTRWYVAGHRAPYVPPMRLYVFASFVLFLAITITRLDSGSALVQTGDIPADTTGARGLTGSELAAAQAELESLRQVLGESMDGAADSSSAGNADASTVIIAERNVSRSEIGRFIKSRTLRINDNPDAFKEQLRRNLPMLLFLLVPLLALELKVLYLRRNRLYVQHLIFALHFQAFAFLWFVFVLLVEQVFEPAEYAFLLLPVYLFIALRRVYGQSRGKTLVKEGILLGLHTIGVFLAFVLYVIAQIALF